MKSEIKRLFFNISSLTIVQLANNLIPLVTLPYILRIIGLENFGIIAFSYAVSTYLSVLVDYGFTTSATRSIAENRSNILNRRELFTSIFLLRSVATFFSLFILFFLILLVEKIENNYIVFLFSFGIVISNLLSPTWIFQGLERMEFLAIFTLISRIFYIILIFSWIQEEQDYIYVPFINSLSLILSGLLGIIMCFYKFEVTFTKVSFYYLKQTFLNAWHIFLSKLYAISYINLNILVLGFMTDNLTLGIYALAERIVLAIQNLTKPLITGFYPFFVRSFSEGKLIFLRRFNKLNFFLVITLIPFTIILLIFADHIIYIFSGEYNQSSTLTLMILSISLSASIIAPSFSNGLLVLNSDKQVSTLTRNNLILCLVLIFPLVYSLSFIGAALTSLISQICLVLYAWYLFKKQLDVRFSINNG